MRVAFVLRSIEVYLLVFRFVSPFYQPFCTCSQHTHLTYLPHHTSHILYLNIFLTLWLHIFWHLFLRGVKYVMSFFWWCYAIPFCTLTSSWLYDYTFFDICFYVVWNMSCLFFGGVTPSHIVTLFWFRCYFFFGYALHFVFFCQTSHIVVIIARLPYITQLNP